MKMYYPIYHVLYVLILKYRIYKQEWQYLRTFRVTYRYKENAVCIKTIYFIITSNKSQNTNQTIKQGIYRVKIFVQIQNNPHIHSKHFNRSSSAVHVNDQQDETHNFHWDPIGVMVTLFFSKVNLIHHGHFPTLAFLLVTMFVFFLYIIGKKKP